MAMAASSAAAAGDASLELAVEAHVAPPPARAAQQQYLFTTAYVRCPYSAMPGAN